MAAATLAELLENAAMRDEPCHSRELDISPGGVDPLGLRQINFQLMDLVLPGLNNVARHITPYTLIAWAWRRAALSALEQGPSFLRPACLLSCFHACPLISVGALAKS